jgi:hypothetical protein
MMPLWIEASILGTIAIGCAVWNYVLIVREGKRKKNDRRKGQG